MWDMDPAWLLVPLVAVPALVALALLASCSEPDFVDCGPGTVLAGTRCVPSTSPVSCGPGTSLVGDQCLPLGAGGGGGVAGGPVGGAIAPAELRLLAEAEPATEVSDENLVQLLRARALLGDTLRTASKRLQQPLERCHALARAHRLPFKVGYVKGGSRI